MPVKEGSINDFGLLISYVLPGYTVLWGAAYLSPELKTWIGPDPSDATLGGFLYVTVASIAAGLTVSTVRWLVVDSLLHATGIRPPNWNFAELRESVAAYDVLLNIHYRYYQWYSNGLLAIAWAYGARRVSLGFFSLGLGWGDLAFVLLEVVFFLGALDTLRKFYCRTGQLLKQARRDDRAGP